MRKWFTSISLCLTCLVAAYCPATAATADTVPFPVSITVISPSNENIRSFDAIVSIQMTDLSLYNDQLYLTYHIDSVNTRRPIDDVLSINNSPYVPVVLDSNGYALVAIAIDASAFSFETMYICFDILDELNNRWLGYTPNTMDDNASIKVAYNAFAEFYRPLLKAFADHPVIAVLNCAFFILAALCLSVTMKKKLLDF